MTMTNGIFLFIFKDNLLHCLRMLNNVTLSRNNFEHFPTGPPKQFAAVQVCQFCLFPNFVWSAVEHSLAAQET